MCDLFDVCGDSEPSCIGKQPFRCYNPPETQKTHAVLSNPTGLLRDSRVIPVMKIIKMRVVDNISTGKKASILRNKAGLTLRQLSENTGLSIGYLSDLEHGRKNWNTKVTIRYLAGI